MKHTVTINQRRIASNILNKVWNTSRDRRGTIAERIGIPEIYISFARNMNKRGDRQGELYFCPHWVVKRIIEWEKANDVNAGHNKIG